jgi:hypothetical protein
MNRLVVVGNGFDLAHNLPTKYCNFKGYVRENFEDFYYAICKYIDTDLLWSDFEYSLGNIDMDSLRNDTFEFLIDYSDDDWSDSYHHDSQYETEKALSFSEKITELLSRWLKDTISFDNVYPKFKHYFTTSNCMFLSFNYTDTLERIYNIPKSEILYIHGKLYGEDAIVCGHNDKYELHMRSFEDGGSLRTEDEDVRIVEAEEIIEDYFKRTRKDTITIIKNNRSFFERCSTLNEIFILGHSLADVDMDYFQAIAKYAHKNCSWNIGYYNNRDKKNIDQKMNKIGISAYIKFELNAKMR